MLAGRGGFSVSTTACINKKGQLSLTNPRDAYRDLEIRVRGHSRSSKVTPFDSLYMVSYYHPIVTLYLKCTVFEI